MSKGFFSSRPWLYRILLFVFAMLCSLVLWMYVTSVQYDDYSRSFNGVAVTFEGEATMRESRGLVITSVSDSSVRFTVSGNRGVISKLESANLNAVINLDTIKTAGTYTIAYSVSYPSGTDTSTLSVTSRSPDTVTFVVDDLVMKEVDVYGVFSGSVAEGYSVQDVQITPASVRISGPQESLDNVASAYVEVTRENVDKTLIYESSYILLDENGEQVTDSSIELETDSVTVTLPVTSIKEIDLAVNIIDGGGATSDNVTVSIEPSTITLSGDADTLAGVNSLAVASIDLADVTEDTFIETYTISLPNDTELVSGSREATVTLEIKGLEKETFSVTNFSVINVTEGYTAEVIQENLEVIVRGTEGALAEVADYNIRAVADLTDIGSATGIVSAPATIYVDGSAEVGAIGEYRVYVNVTAE
ncbi:MAG: hypothetical protein LUE15_00400 [Oscillospiraceae bacterium]|nr:hypothetical protein [Oscillospiraceae bacterium]